MYKGNSGRRMHTLWTTAVFVISMTLLALAPRLAAAQSNPFDRSEAPPMAYNFGGGTVRSLEEEFQSDLHTLGAFAGRKSVDRYERVEIERAQPWKLYGRLGPMHFQNRLDSSEQRTQFTFRRTGPSLGGRIYIGIHRTFD